MIGASVSAGSLQDLANLVALVQEITKNGPAIAAKAEELKEADRKLLERRASVESQEAELAAKVADADARALAARNAEAAAEASKESARAVILEMAHAQQEAHNAEVRLHERAVELDALEKRLLAEARQQLAKAEERAKKLAEAEASVAARGKELEEFASELASRELDLAERITRLKAAVGVEEQHG